MYYFPACHKKHKDYGYLWVLKSVILVFNSIRCQFWNKITLNKHDFVTCPKKSMLHEDLTTFPLFIAIKKYLIVYTQCDLELVRFFMELHNLGRKGIKKISRSITSDWAFISYFSKVEQLPQLRRVSLEMFGFEWCRYCIDVDFSNLYGEGSISGLHFCTFVTRFCTWEIWRRYH